MVVICLFTVVFTKFRKQLYGDYCEKVKDNKAMSFFG